MSPLSLLVVLTSVVIFGLLCFSTVISPLRKIKTFFKHFQCPDISFCIWVTIILAWFQLQCSRSTSTRNLAGGGEGGPAWSKQNYHNPCIASSGASGAKEKFTLQCNLLSPWDTQPSDFGRLEMPAEEANPCNPALIPVWGRHVLALPEAGKESYISLLISTDFAALGLYAMTSCQIFSSQAFLLSQ